MVYLLKMVDLSMANCERHNQMVSIIYWHHCGEEINMSLSMLTQVQLNKGP